MINIFTDGGARGNPGPAAIGVAVYRDKEVLHEHGETIGSTTNNVAEYRAVLYALQWLHKHQEEIGHEVKIQFFLDSELVVRQLNGIYRVKNSFLREIMLQIRAEEQGLPPLIYTHIRREYNKHADSMVNQALDNQV
jgi:ribonuclease HI